MKNQAQEIQARTQMYQLMMQTPGLSVEWMLKDMLRVLDPRINYEDAIDIGALSIVAMNGMQQATANRGGEADPEAQGDKGASNAPTPEPGGQQGPQPAPPPGSTTASIM
jgi:hypothetical protein